MEPGAIVITCRSLTGSVESKIVFRRMRYGNSVSAIFWDACCDRSLCFLFRKLVLRCKSLRGPFQRCETDWMTVFVLGLIFNTGQRKRLLDIF